MELLSKVCNTDTMNLERLAARVFVALGGAFWIAAVFGMDFGYRGKGVLDAAQSALLPLAIVVVALGIGWFFENLAAVLLLAGVVAGVAWGVVTGWEAGVWWIMAGVLFGPMAISALLFFLAARMQRVCELSTK